MTSSDPRRRAATFILTTLLALSVILIGQPRLPAASPPLAAARGEAVAAAKAERVQKLREMIGRGTRFYEAARFADALACYEQAQRLAPDYEPLRAAISDARDNLKYQQALVRSIKASGAKPDQEAKAKYDRARELYSAGESEKARMQFWEVWLLAGDYRDTRQYLTRIHNGETQVAAPEKAQARVKPEVQSATAQSEKPQETGEARIEAALAQAKALLDAGKVDDALKAYQAVLAVDDGNRNARKGAKRATKLIARREKEAAERNREIAEAMANARALQEEGEYAKSMAHFREALSLDPENADARKGYDQARTALEKAQAEQARREMALTQALEAGHTALQADNYAKAREAYASALQLDEGNRTARKGLARAEKAIAKQAEAKAEKKAELAEAIADGKELLAAEKYEKALKVFEEAQRIDPASPEASQGRLAALKAVEGAREAERAQRQAVAQAVQQGNALLETGKAQEAVRAFEVALRADADSKPAREGREEALKRVAAEERRRAEELERKREEARVAAEKKAEQKRIAAERKAEQERLAKAAAEKQAEEAKMAATRKAAEEKAQQERIAAAKAQEAERLAAEKKAEAARVAKAEAEKKAEAARLAAAERKAAEEKAEQERIAAQTKAEEERIAAAKKAEQERIAAGQKAEEKRLAAERAQQKLADDIEQAVVRGHDLLSAGDYAAAEKAFQDAMKLDSGNRGAAKGLKEVEEARTAAAERKAAEEAEAKAAAAREKEAKQAADLEASIAQGVERLQAGEYADAAKSFQAALDLDPNNRKARRGLKRAHVLFEQAQQLAAQESAKPVQVADSGASTGVQYRGPEEAEQPTPREKTRQLRDMLAEADAVYSQEKDIARAREIWRKVLEIDPENKVAKTMLEGTQEQYERYVADMKKRQDAIKAERAAREKMEGPITISTTDATPLSEFLQTLSLPSGINFTIAEGAEAMVNVNFVDKPLREILDMVLHPIGLQWTRKGDVVIVSADLKTKTYHLSAPEMAKIQTLIEDKTLQRLLWGPKAAPPLKRTVLQLEERENLLLAVDSNENVEKLTAFLSDLRVEQPAELVTRIYTIREKNGPEIKALIDAVLRAEKTPYDLERSVFLEGKNLIIRDTPTHIKKIEEILLDKDFIREIGNENLQIATFNLAPRSELAADHSQARAFFHRTREVIETFLYGEEGKSKAAAEGRRMWYDEDVYQITITDYPSGIRAVSDFIATLPQIRQDQREAVIFLQHLESTEMASQLSDILGLSGGAGASGGVGGGQERTFRLRRDQEVEWQDLRIRLRRVEENDVQDDSDDSCELVVRTPTESTEETIDEFLSVFVGDYEIVADDIRPSGTSGDGSVRLIVRYIPPAGADTAAAAVPTPAPVEGPAEPVINSFGSQNALIIRYEDPADLQRIRELIDQLDKPVPQVDIETRFVTVNEQRAKEFSSDLQWFDRDAPMPSYGDFGQFELTDTQIGGLTDSVGKFSDYTLIDTWFQEIFGYKVFWGLTMLEAEGIVNITNGPRILVLDGESANFIIERPVITEVEYDDNGNITEITYEWREVVNLDVTPEVTSEESILMDLDIFIEDRGFDETGAGLDSYNTSPVWARYPYNSPSGRFNTSAAIQTFKDNSDMGGPRKTVETQARIKSGGTAVLGGWTGEFSEDMTSGIPVLRNLPWLGKLFFSRNRASVHKTNLLIFLTGRIVD